MAEEEIEIRANASFEDLEAEVVLPHWFNGSLIFPDYDLWRMNTPKGRLYWRFQDRVNQLEPMFYYGTTNVGKEIPKPETLEKWMAEKGWSESKRFFYLRMLYGSFSHSRLTDLIMLRKTSFDDLPDMLKAYFYDQRFTISDKEFSDLRIEIKKDMIAIERWVLDHDVEFVFSEFPVYSDVDNVGSQLDVGCFCTIREGEARKKQDVRIFALINYKSGKSGVHEEYKYQLESEKNMFLERYPDFTNLPIRTYNLAAKDWKTTNWNNRTRPYLFSDQTDSANIDRYNHYMGLAKLTRDERLEQPIVTITGEMNLGDDPLKNISCKTLKEIVMEGLWKNYVKTSASIPQTV